MRNIEIYTSQGCGYCSAARSMLRNMGLDFKEFDLTRDGSGRQKLIERTGRRTVPQIFVDGESIGGYEGTGHDESLGRTSLSGIGGRTISLSFRRFDRLTCRPPIFFLKSNNEQYCLAGVVPEIR